MLSYKMEVLILKAKMTPIAELGFSFSRTSIFDSFSMKSLAV